MKLLSTTITPILFILIAHQAGLAYSINQDDPYADKTHYFDSDWKGTGVRVCEVSDWFMYGIEPDSSNEECTNPGNIHPELDSLEACATACIYDPGCGMYSYANAGATIYLEGCCQLPAHLLKWVTWVYAEGTWTGGRDPATLPPPIDPDAPSGGGGATCFSETATVETLDRGIVPMKDVKVGDRVYTGQDPQNPNKPLYQPIFSFGHYHEMLAAEFLQIHTNVNPRLSPLEVTGNHLVYAVGTDGKLLAVRADAVKIGDTLVHEEPSGHASIPATVTKISSTVKNGLYMPLTPDGSIVVNGLKASNYVSIKDEAPSAVETALITFHMTEDNLSHWWLSPYRMLCMGVSSSFCTSKIADTFWNDEGILGWLVLGKQLAEFGEKQAFFVQVLVFGVPLFFVFAACNIVERLFSPSMAPILTLLMGAGLIYYRRMRKEISCKKSNVTQKKSV